MTITVSPEDTILFEQNGFTYNDIKNTISHYRENGLSDDDIQLKINNRINEFKNTSLNSKAFENIQELPQENEYIKQGNYELNQLASIYYSPEEIEQMKQKGAIGWWELAKKTDKTERIPFSGEIEAIGKTTRLNIISNKVEKGEEINPQDKAFLDDFMKGYIETSIRGTTWGANVANVVMDMPAWAIEIASISAVTGGTGSIPATAKKVAAKSGIKAATTYATKALLKSAQKAGVKGMAINAAKTNTVLAPRIIENYAQRRISDGIAITDKGEAYLQEVEEKPATTLLKAFADTNIEAGTEMIAGQYLNLAGDLVAKSGVGKAVKEGFKKAFDLLPKKTRVALESAVQKLKPNETVESLIRKGGFNGVLEEMGEERIADILRTTLDIDQEEGYSIDQFMKAINPGADQLLVELGAFSIMGGVSRAGSLLYNNLRVQGYSHEEATNVVNNLSETEKDNFVNSEIVKDNFTVNSDITKEEIKEYEQLEQVTLKNSDELNIENDYKNLNPVLQRKLSNYKSIEEFYRDYSIVENLIKNGAKINEDGTVTLYHAGNKKEILKDKRFKATTAAKGGMTGYETKSVFFGFDKEWVKKWSSGGSKEIIEINVPIEYIKQPAQNEMEVYLDGDVVLTDESKNIWTPQDKIYDNFYTQIPAKRAESKLNNIFNQYNNQTNSKAETNKNYKTYDDFISEFSQMLEEEPQDYTIDNVEDAIKDLGITEEKPKIVKTPIENIEIRVSSIEHIINGGGSKHLPDKTRYKCINKMLNTLESPYLILENKNGNKEYIKIFKNKNKSKNQIVIINNDENGDYVYTAFPVSKDKKYILEELNKGNIIYKKGQTRAEIGSAAISTIPQNDSNLNPNELETLQEETTNLTPEQRLEEAKQNFKEFKKVRKESERLVNKILAPISTELDVINSKLKIALRKFEFETGIKENEYAKPVKNYIQKVDKMEKEDYAVYDLALKNRDVEIINLLNKKYNITEEFKEIKTLLDNIYQDAKNVDMDFGKLDDYFPRSVINPAAFIEEVTKNTFIKKALKELDPNNKLTNEEKVEAVNSILRGYGNKISLSSSGFTKERKVKEVTPELNQYYKDSMSALVDYISSMNTNIQAKKFFGKGKEIEDSIGAYVKSLIDEGFISARDEARAKEILTSRFNQKGPNELVSTYKNISYLSTMGNPLSAITQIGDLAFSMYKNGVYDSFIGFSAALKGKGITREDLGIEKIAQEFSEQSKSSKAVNLVFKAVGLDFMDKMGKETFINASYNRLKKLADKPTEEFNSMLKEIFGKEAEQVKKDLKNDIVSENVKYLLFSELSDFQPISLAEMPQNYLTGGNARVFYMLKTYTIKQLDIYRNEIFRKFKDEPVEAIKNAIKLSALLVIANATADTLKDLLLGRPIELEDLVIDNLLKLAGFSKWQVYKARREGAFTTLLQSILPPTNLLDDLSKDTTKSIENGEIKFNELNLIKNIPLAGKLYYWWFGKGSKTETKSGTYDKFSKELNKAKKANEKLKELQGEERANFINKKAKDIENYNALKSYDSQIKKLKRERKNLEKTGNKKGIKEINKQIDQVAKAALKTIQ